MEDDNGKREYSLSESLEMAWIKLPICVMRRSGSATQTLGGLLRITGSETFRQREEIAEKSALPLSTTKKHLRTLGQDGWIVREGRQRTPGGTLRRTATIKIPESTKEAIRRDGWHPLPWFAARDRKMTWSEKAILSVVMSRLMKFKSAAVRESGLEDDVEGWLENAGGEDRWKFTLDHLESQTGLSRRAVIRGKKRLHRLRIIRWSSSESKVGGSGPDILEPNWEFRVVEMPARNKPGWISVEYSP